MLWPRSIGYGRAVPGAERIPVAGSGSAVSIEKLAELGVSRAFVWYYQTNPETAA